MAKIEDPFNIFASQPAILWFLVTGAPTASACPFFGVVLILTVQSSVLDEGTPSLLILTDNEWSGGDAPIIFVSYPGAAVWAGPSGIIGFGRAMQQFQTQQVYKEKRVIELLCLESILGTIFYLRAFLVKQSYW
jgi:hypothetical protein